MYIRWYVAIGVDDNPPEMEMIGRLF